MIGPIRDSSDPNRHSVALKKILSKSKAYGHPRTKIREEDIDYTAELQAFDNPRPKKIDRLYLSVGIKSLLSKVSWSRCSSADVRSKLEALVGKRNSIAHGDVGTKVSLGEVKEHRRFLPLFAENVAEIVRSHVASTTGQSPW